MALSEGKRQLQTPELFESQEQILPRFQGNFPFAGLDFASR